MPFDTQGAVLKGTSLLRGSLPRGLSSIRWVPKKHSDKVRVTMNMSPYKPFFDPDAVAVELDTNLKLRHRIYDTDVFVGADQHNSFFHYAIAPAHRTYAGFSLHVRDFPPGVGLDLANKYPQAVLRLGASQSISQHRFDAGDFRLVFVMAGLPMGISPAVKMLSFVMDAVIEVWCLFPVGSGETIELPRGSNYIDDSAFMLSRSHPVNGFELSCRIVLEYVLLGFRLNWLKGHFLPTPWLKHLGLLLQANPVSGCSFALTESRAANVALTLAKLAGVVVVGHRVPLLSVAAVVGTIWSIHAVAHRAVAIMCRSMIAVLAVALRVPLIQLERDPRRLAALLKRAWKGHGVWTPQAHIELTFWSGVPFHNLVAAMHHDATATRLRAWVAAPDGTTMADVRLFSVDTSDSGSGGAELVRDGALWALKRGSSMFVRLAAEEVSTSSTMRELLGVLRLDLTSIPSDCSRAIVLCDSQAAVSCLLRGSKVPALQAVVARVFERQLRSGRILFPVWTRRNEQHIVAVDMISRTAVGCTLATPPGLFALANSKAVTLWGRGFQLDAFADLHNVVPPDSGVRLPFFSRYNGPHASGVDAFLQDWRGLVVWANAPFGLIGRVLALLRAQAATAALVVPVGSKAPWARQIRPGAVGVRAFVTYSPNAAAFKMRGIGATAAPYRGLYALAFLDFRTSDSNDWLSSPSAEALPALRTPASRPHFLTLPSRPMSRPTSPSLLPQAPEQR